MKDCPIVHTRFLSERKRSRMMKSWLAIVLILTIFGSATLQGAEPAEEEALIGVLNSGATLQEKDAACVRLKRMGTVRSVPALAALLSDEDLSHSARYALESMPVPEAGAALLAALDGTTGLIQAGIVQSLGQRGDAQAVALLIKLLADSDPNVAAASADSLGRIGGPEALAALQVALPKAGEMVVRGAMLDGLLRIADQELRQASAPGDAFKVYEQIYASDAEDRFRIAAYCGMIRSAGERALPLAIEGIQGSDGLARIAAMQTAHEIQGAAATESFAKLLPDVQPAVQIALIELLRQRGDRQAVPAVIDLVGSDDEGVRVASIQALSDLGDDSAVARLVEVASSSREAEKKAARQSLLDLRQGDVSGALFMHLSADKPVVQAEAVRALVGRGDDDANWRARHRSPRSPGWSSMRKASRCARRRPMRCLPHAKGSRSAVMLLTCSRLWTA